MTVFYSLHYLGFVLLTFGGVSSANAESRATSVRTCLPRKQETYEQESPGTETDRDLEECEKAGRSPFMRLACEAHRRAWISVKDCCGDGGDTYALCGEPDVQDLAGKQMQEGGEMTEILNSQNTRSSSVGTVEIFQRRDTRKKGQPVWRQRNPFLDRFKSQFLGKRRA